MNLYAFWKYDVPPFLLGGEVISVTEDGYVTVKGYSGKFKPELIVPIEKGIKIHKKLNKANAKYKEKVNEAQEELLAVIKSITN